MLIIDPFLERKFEAVLHPIVPKRLVFIILSKNFLFTLSIDFHSKYPRIYITVESVENFIADFAVSKCEFSLTTLPFINLIC